MQLDIKEDTKELEQDKLHAIQQKIKQCYLKIKYNLKLNLHYGPSEHSKFAVPYRLANTP
jgi:hypothetical protein